VAASPALLPARASRARRRLPCNGRIARTPTAVTTRRVASACGLEPRVAAHLLLASRHEDAEPRWHQARSRRSVPAMVR
jgi:hypothetical protein